jgi:DNA-binding transcriptional LysR family regulator
VWRFTRTTGEVATVTPTGPLRVTNVEALLPSLLDGVAIGELPEFIAADYLRDGRLVPLLPDWNMALGGLYFVTPSARPRSARVEALARFLVDRLASDKS